MGEILFSLFLLKTMLKTVLKMLKTSNSVENLLKTCWKLWKYWQECWKLVENVENLLKTIGTKSRYFLFLKIIFIHHQQKPKNQIFKNNLKQLFPITSPSLPPYNTPLFPTTSHKTPPNQHSFPTLTLFFPHFNHHYNPKKPLKIIIIFPLNHITALQHNSP